MKAMTIDNGLQNFSNSEGAVVVLFVEARSPLSSLMVTRVVDIEYKLQRIQDLRVKALDANFEIVSCSFDGTRPL